MCCVCVSSHNVMCVCHPGAKHILRDYMILLLLLTHSSQNRPKIYSAHKRTHILNVVDREIRYIPSTLTLHLLRLERYMVYICEMERSILYGVDNNVA